MGRGRDMRRPLGYKESMRRGLALLIVVGVLGVLAVLATAFVTMAQLERRASRQRLYATKARLLARSGLEDALARLTNGQEASLPGTAFAGEDFDDDGSLSPGRETDAEVFQKGKLNREDCPARYALRPSFFARDPAGDPAPRPVEGRLRGYSGLLKGDLAVDGNVYALKVEDESAKININGGFLDLVDRDNDGVQDYHDVAVRETRYGPVGAPKDTGRGWNAQLVRILNVLGSQSDIGIQNLGIVLVQNRPLGGWREVPGPAQLAAAGLKAVDLSPYLTTSSWTDHKVVHSNSYAGEILPPWNPIGIANPAWAPSSKHVLSLFYSRYSELKKGRYPLVPEEEGRPPVNLNAAPRPVLIALIQGLQGQAWGNIYQQFSPPKGERAAAYAFSQPLMVAQIADALIAFREGRDPSGVFAAAGLAPGPFRDRDQFDAFCDSLVPSVVKGFKGGSLSVTYQASNLCAADILKANFDPNTRLNKDQPDQVLWRWADKSDLLVWSTEGNLGPTGMFKVSAVGRLLDRDGRLLAERTASLAVEAFSLVRQTTQQDFVAGRALDGSLLSPLSLSTAALYQTTGTKDPQSPPAWHTWADPAGLAVITAPCPPMALPGRAADFDGCVGLATTQLPGEDPSASDRLTFLHHFDGGWDAARAPTALQKVHLPKGGPTDLESKYRQEDPSESVWPPSPGAEPNTLLPDGMYAQPYRSVDFAPQGFFPTVMQAGVPTNHGVFLYWMKLGHAQFSEARVARFTRRIQPDPAVEPVTHAVNAGGYFDGLFLGAGVHLENWAQIPDDPIPTYGEMVTASRESGNNGGNKRRWPVSRWHLTAALFDSGFQTYPETMEAALWGLPTNGGLPGEVGEGTSHTLSMYDSATFNTLVNEDLMDPAKGTPYFTLGDGFCVLDEFAIYDFGVNTGGDAWLKAKGWAGGRFQDGRYYKQGDGVFLSGVLEPSAGAPVRLLNAWWTAHLPTARRVEAMEAQSLPDDTPPVPRGTDGLLRYPDGRSRLWVDLDLLPETGNQASPGLQSLVQGGWIGRSLSNFRYRVRFRTDLESPFNDPVLESPWFDDITFAWQAATGPKVRAWGP